MVKKQGMSLMNVPLWVQKFDIVLKLLLQKCLNEWSIQIGILTEGGDIEIYLMFVPKL